ncbi:MAG: YcaQ family DNA glycosylase [Myxococcales bacterium]|nr:YcaQ family DNA glycosylase [Myxococcales bacterium]
MPPASTIALSTRAARRLAIARAGLWRPEPTGLPSRARRRPADAEADAHAIIDRFGYLQLDTVAVSGARSHAIVLLSRLPGLTIDQAEALLRPGAPLFEYWGHEVSWIPLDLYPAFAFRRREFQTHPWWGDLLGEHPKVARDIVKRIADEGPLRSADLEGSSGAGWWNLKLTKKVATALWSAGELAISERRAFLRAFDLSERVIPAATRARALSEDEALRVLLLRALAGHGWATTSTLAATWRLRNRRPAIQRALAELVEAGEIVAASLVSDEGGRRPGWIRPADLELLARLERARPRADRGVLLSPFDPLLWDRARVRELFGFDQILEIFKPPSQRVYGYYCMPVLAADRLIARVDLKAERRGGHLKVLALHREGRGADERRAIDHALTSYADALGLALRR